MSKARKVEGVVQRIGVEGGVWALVTDAGETIELLGAPAELKKAGARASVELDGEGADVTIGMVGGSGRVRSFTLI